MVNDAVPTAMLDSCQSGPVQGTRPVEPSDPMSNRKFNALAMKLRRRPAGSMADDQKMRPLQFPGNLHRLIASANEHSRPSWWAKHTRSYFR